MLSYRSKVLLVVHGGVLFSVQRSGMVNGLTHVIAFAAEASAVAVATMSAVLIPKYCAIIVETGFPRFAVRYTVTFTRSGDPSTGSFGNSTSAGPMPRTIGTNR